MKEKYSGQRILIPAVVREYILQRDGFRCLGCGKTASQAKLQIDHIVPIAHGGSNDISNLQTLCRDCNLRKKDRLDPRFHQHFRL
ncbi:MAG: HNH endonuclease [Cyanobacteriota bacterium]